MSARGIRAGIRPDPHPDQIRAELARLGVSVPGAADLLGVSRIVMWRWANARSQMPQPAWRLLRLLETPTTE